jgi:hypothetical protein
MEELLAVNGSIPASPNVTGFSGNLARPAGVAVDGSGNVYVADTGNNAIEKALAAINGSYSVINRLYTFTGTLGPAGVALDGSGNVYVSDIGSNTVYEILAARSSIYAPYTAITLGSNFNYPYGVAVDGSGNVYVGDTMNNRVVKIAPLAGNFGPENIGTTSPAIPMTFTFDTAGTLGSMAVLTQGVTGLDFANAGTGSCKANTAYTAGQTCIINVTFTPRYAGSRYGAAVLYNSTGSVIATGYVQGSGVGPQVNFLPGAQSVLPAISLNAPYGVAVDGGGNVYILDTNNSRVVKETLSADNYTQSTVATGIAVGFGVAVDGAGNVYIADTGNNRVLKETLSASGYTQSTLASGVGYPMGVAVDGSGNVYITDTEFGQVLKETLAAGSYIQSTVASGLNNPSGVAVDGGGNVYIADTENFRVLKETLSAGSYTQSTLPVTGQIVPQAIAVDGSGNVYFEDASQNAVLKETLSAGNYLESTLFSGLNAGTGPFGITVDGSENLYIGYAGNNQVLKVDFADPPSLTFAATSNGATSADSPQTVTVENIGNATLNFPIPSTGNNPSIATNFTLNDSGTSACAVLSASSSEPATLAAGASCMLPISFAPTAAGTLSGSLVLTDNNLNAAAPGYTMQTIALSGSGLQATPQISWATPAAITYGTALSATQLTASSTLAGSFAYSPVAGTVLTAGAQPLTVTFTPTDTTDYTTATATVTLTVNKATPQITWATPAAITYGTPLSGTQLNASSTVVGSFTYLPAAGTVLTAGTQTLTVTFTPTDTTDYTTATASVTLAVNKATPTITWATPAAITYGTALSATQLNASSTVVGSFTYSPAAGTVLAAGTQPLTVTFTPTNTTNYTTATDSVTLTVNPAPSFTLSATPTSLTVARGSSGTSTIKVSGQNGFTGSITLAASGMPSGVTAAFATNPTTGSSVLTLTVSSSATTGTSTVTIKGTSGSLTASTTVALTISCTSTAIVPYISINKGSTWTEESSATVSSPSTAVDLGPQPSSGGSWNWTGPNKYTSTSRQINSIPLTVGTDSYVATYTNSSGCKSTETFTITVK